MATVLVFLITQLCHGKDRLEGLECVCVWGYLASSCSRVLMSQMGLVAVMAVNPAERRSPIRHRRNQERGGGGHAQELPWWVGVGGFYGT